jgi:hypothetical protein
MSAKTKATTIPLINPQSAFQAATDYEYTACMLLNETRARIEGETANGAANFHTPAGFPAVVIYALAVEVYFKCLIRLETGANPKFEHRLRELFDDLFTDTQKRIRDEYDRIWATDPGLQVMAKHNHPALPPGFFKFDQTLDNASEMFSRFRYYYEPQQKISNPEIIGIATRTIILQDHPEWTPAVKCLEKVPTFLAR